MSRTRGEIENFRALLWNLHLLH